MKKGIIMEIDDAFLTLITPEGEFLRSKKMDRIYSIGEEINFFPTESGKTTKPLNAFKNIFRVKTVWAVMAALLIFLGSLIPIPIYKDNNAYAYMSIDVKPSIELGVNKKMQVIELTGFNKEGRKIISKLGDWKKNNVTDVAQSILTAMKMAGFTNNHEHIIISTVRTNPQDDTAEKELQNNLKEIKAAVNEQKLDLTVNTATKEERDKAKELGITAGKYQENKKQSSQIGNNQVKNSSVETKKMIPSGQIKQQSENNMEKNQAVTENKQDNQTNWKENPTPSGQLKKSDQEQLKQNQGQLKKPIQEQENTNKLNNGNQNQKEKNSNDQDKWKENNQQKSNGQNQWNQQQKSNGQNQGDYQQKSNGPQWNHQNKQNDSKQNNHKNK